MFLKDLISNESHSTYCTLEFQGKQHYEWIPGMMTEQAFYNLQEHDIRKVNYCKDKKIKLIIIPYWEFKNIEQILEIELKLHKQESA